MADGGGVRKREDDGDVEDRKRPRSEAPAGAEVQAAVPVEATPAKEEDGKRSQEECDEDDVWSAIESSPIALDGRSSGSNGGGHGAGDSGGGFYSCDGEQLELLLSSGAAYDAPEPSLSPLGDQVLEDWIVEPAAAGFAARGQCGREAWSPLAIVS